MVTEDAPLEKKPAPAVEKPHAPAPVAPAPVAEGEVRASDADRDRVADILREALAEGRLDAEEHGQRIDAAYAAKTMGELEPIVRDLPVGRGTGGEARAADRPGSSGASFSASYSSSPAAYGYGHGAGMHGAAFGPKENLVAIFSGSMRKGRWRVPRKINAFAMFGGIEIDLTEAIFEHPHLVINATAIFGGIDIRVPENVTLQQKGSGIFGGFDIRVMDSPDPNAPVILVQGAGIFGGVEAKPKRGKLIKDLRDRFRKEP